MESAKKKSAEKWVSKFFQVLLAEKWVSKFSNPREADHQSRSAEF